MSDIQFAGRVGDSLAVAVDLGEEVALLDADLFFVDKDTFKPIPIQDKQVVAGHAKWIVAANKLDGWGWGYCTFYVLITPAAQNAPDQVDVGLTVAQGGHILPARKKGVPINGMPPNFKPVSLEPIPANTISRRPFDVTFQGGK